MEFNQNNKYSEEFFEQYKTNFMNNGSERNFNTSNKRQQKKSQKFFLRRLIALILAVAVIISAVFVVKSLIKTEQAPQNTSSANAVEKPVVSESAAEKVDYNFYADSNTVKFTTQLSSEYGIFTELSEKKIIGEKQSDKIIYPASLTKILTLLVAVENLKSLDETFTMTIEIIDPLYREGASMAGFSVGETVTAKDLLYGMILPSGADAAEGIARLVAGSQEEFVKMMNEKVKELGLTTAHFANTSGLHSKDNYCTVKDMAVILNAAIHNETCKEILSAYKYTTQSTDKHPNGIELTSTMFSRMYGTEPETATILAGKTGFINESGNCLASYGVSETGKEYICVTTMAHGMWKSVFDHINTYRDYAEKLPKQEISNVSSEEQNAGN